MSAADDKRAKRLQYMRDWHKTAAPRKLEPCECGRGIKTANNRGCKQCNENQAKYESSFSPKRGNENAWQRKYAEHFTPLNRGTRTQPNL